MALFGEGVVHWPTLFSVGLFPIIVAVFFSLARNEERRMLEQFGKEFGAYRQRVPMFVPQWSQCRPFDRHSHTAAGRDYTPLRATKTDDFITFRYYFTLTHHGRLSRTQATAH